MQSLPARLQVEDHTIRNWKSFL